MFKRRQPLSIFQNLREVFWPSMGWMRAFHYTKHRVIRLSDTTRSIALGLAIGAGISFTPFVGTHLLQAGLIAYMLRINIASALIGTFVGNPWTFPFMWWGAMSFGSFLMDTVLGIPASATLPETVSLGVIWDLMWNEPLRIFVPWFIGGYLLCALSVPFSYMVFYNLVSGAKLARRKAQERKLHKVAKDVTGQTK